MTRVNEDVTYGENTVALVKEFEGLVLRAARCPEGVPTAGWGHTGPDVVLGKTYTREQAEAWLKADLDEHADAVRDAVTVPLNRNELGALASFSFNVGKGWLTGKGHTQASFVKLLDRGNYDAVPSQLMLFVHGANSGRSYDGLARRRASEGHLFKTPVVGTDIDVQTPPPLPDSPAIDVSASVPMPQAVTIEPIGLYSVAGALSRSRTLYGSVKIAAGLAFEATVGPTQLIPGILHDLADKASGINASLATVFSVAGINAPTRLGLIAACLGLIVVANSRIVAAFERKIG